VAKGEVSVNGTALKQGDGAAIAEEKQVVVEAKTEAEVLLFDLA
jgi:quercetin 2,3-dioxygenase